MNVTDLIGKFVVFYVVGGDVKYPTMMDVDQVSDVAGKLFLIGSQPKKLMGVHNWLGYVPTHIFFWSIQKLENSRNEVLMFLKIITPSMF